MSSRSKRDKFSKDIQSHLDQAEMEIIRAVADLLVHKETSSQCYHSYENWGCNNGGFDQFLFQRILSDLSPQCDPLMSIWDDMGSYLCNVVAVPTQGLWVACRTFMNFCFVRFQYYYVMCNTFVRTPRSGSSSRCETSHECLSGAA